MKGQSVRVDFCTSSIIYWSFSSCIKFRVTEIFKNTRDRQTEKSETDFNVKTVYLFQAQFRKCNIVKEKKKNDNDKV